METLGYQFLVERYELAVPALYKKSYLSKSSKASREVFPDGIEDYFPNRFRSVERTWEDQLLFALKNEGVTLSVLNALFKKLPEEELTAFVLKEPTGKYRRRVWFFYEFLTGRELPIPPIEQGNYIEALDPEEYFTAVASPSRPEVRARRMRVVNNLIGNRGFCPAIRRTERIRQNQKTDLKALIHNIESSYPPELIFNATHYLCVKETKSSFAIERLTPDQKRMARFVEILRRKTSKTLSKEVLIQLQNDIVDPRYADHDYRTTQVYVGESVSLTDERVHYIAPKPEEIGEMMEAYLAMTNDLLKTKSDPILIAAVVSFAFVFLHPFDDGNGRLHRYLLHYVLSRLCFIPDGMIFPFSAQFYKNPVQYDRMLESVSFRLIPLIEYRLNSRTGEMMIENETADFYRFINMTEIAELFYPMVIKAIEEDFEDELKYLCDMGQACQEMREIVDMPEEKVRLFITFVRQNHGELPKSRRKLFVELTDEEIEKLAAIVKTYLCPKES